MTPAKADLLDHYASPKISAGRSGDARYAALRARLREVGFFTPAPYHYAFRISLCLIIFVFAFIELCRAPSLPMRAACLVGIGFVLTQGGFIGHEALHGSITKRRWAIALIGQVFHTMLVGLAFNAFRRSHLLHHFHCNETTHDPDIQSSVLATHPAGAASKQGIGRWTT